MQVIEIEVDNKVISNVDYHMYKPGIENKYPRLYRVSDGASVLFWNSTHCGTWQDQRTTEQIISYIKPVQKSLTAPNVGISELTFLRAIAVSQDPSLIRTMT